MAILHTITQLRRYYFLNKKTAKNFSRFKFYVIRFLSLNYQTL